MFWEGFLIAVTPGVVIYVMGCHRWGLFWLEKSVYEDLKRLFGRSES